MSKQALFSVLGDLSSYTSAQILLAIKANLNQYSSENLGRIMDEVERRASLIPAIPVNCRLSCVEAKQEFKRIASVRKFFDTIRSMFRENSQDLKGDSPLQGRLSACMSKTYTAINLTPEMFARLAIRSHRDAFHVLGVIYGYPMSSKEVIFRSLSRKMSVARFNCIIEDLLLVGVIEYREFDREKNKNIVRYSLTTFGGTVYLKLCYQYK